MSHKYLDYIREQNKILASKCHYCRKPTIGINAVAERIIFVCTNHYIPDNNNVVHRVYPQGMSVPEHMMDPNIGGSFSLKQAEKPQKIHQNEDNI